MAHLKTGNTDAARIYCLRWRYNYVFLMMGWLSDDMREEPEEIVGRLDRLLEGEFRRAAEKFSAGEPVS